MEISRILSDILVSAIAALSTFHPESKNFTDAEIRHELEGNLCRCTGYQNIVNSVKYAAEKMQGQSAD